MKQQFQLIYDCEPLNDLNMREDALQAMELFYMENYMDQSLDRDEDGFREWLSKQESDDLYLVENVLYKLENVVGVSTTIEEVSSYVEYWIDNYELA